MKIMKHLFIKKKNRFYFFRTKETYKKKKLRLNTFRTLNMFVITILHIYNNKTRNNICMCCVDHVVNIVPILIISN